MFIYVYIDIYVCMYVNAKLVLASRELSDILDFASPRITGSGFPLS